MNKKRVYSFVLFSLLVALFLFNLALPLVSAPTGQFSTDLVKGIQDFFSPILQPLLGVQEGQDSMFFERFLMAFLIVAVLYMVLDNTPVIRTNSFSMWSIIIVVAVLSIRYIGSIGFVQVLFTQQGILGISLLSAIPFMVYFWFVEFGLTGSRVMRKIMWSLFAAVYFFLWLKLYLSGTLAFTGNPAYIYLVAGIIAVVIMFMDGTIQGAIYNSKIQTMKDRTKAHHLEVQRKKMDEAYSVWINASADNPDKPKLKANYESEKKTFEDMLKAD